MTVLDFFFMDFFFFVGHQRDYEILHGLPIGCKGNIKRSGDRRLPTSQGIINSKPYLCFLSKHFEWLTKKHTNNPFKETHPYYWCLGDMGLVGTRGSSKGPQKFSRARKV